MEVTNNHTDKEIEITFSHSEAVEVVAALMEGYSTIENDTLKEFIHGLMNPKIKEGRD